MEKVRLKSIINITPLACKSLRVTAQECITDGFGSLTQVKGTIFFLVLPSTEAILFKI